MLAFNAKVHVITDMQTLHCQSAPGQCGFRECDGQSREADGRRLWLQAVNMDKLMGLVNCRSITN
jgi:hypothetical protein